MFFFNKHNVCKHNESVLWWKIKHNTGDQYSLYDSRSQNRWLRWLEWRLSHLVVVGQLVVRNKFWPRYPASWSRRKIRPIWLWRPHEWTQMYGPLHTTRQVLYDCMHCRTFLCVLQLQLLDHLLELTFRKRVSFRFKWRCSVSTSSLNDDTNIRAKLKNFLGCSRFLWLNVS